uniref:Uncharacterized protein n=1 Tax=Rhizophora mucronata TaxID=61149 RepID=A0A2P2QZQ7_RHIMU
MSCIDSIIVKITSINQCQIYHKIFGLLKCKYHFTSKLKTTFKTN